MNANPAKPQKGWIRDWTETIVVALVLALIIRAFVIQVFFIPSGSMIPTLDVGDRIIVNKFIYRFHPPRRFDIIVFEYPYNKLSEGTNMTWESVKKWVGLSNDLKDFIKRVVGLPGETVQVKRGQVYINGQPLAEKHLFNRDASDFGPYRIPDDGYFMMGDNRGNSADSRVWGYLPKKYIFGPAVFRIWPLSRFGMIP